MPDFGTSVKEDLFTFDDEEIEAGRLLFAGPCDFISAAQNLTALPPIIYLN